MNICFFNCEHLGDSFFSEPFIRNICNSNPDCTFFQWCPYGSELIMGSSNLYYLEDTYNNQYKNGYKYGDFPELYTEDNDIKHIFISNIATPEFTFFYHNTKYIAFNIWCGAIAHAHDLEFKHIYNGFYNLLHKINQKYSKTFKIQPLGTFQLLPSLRDVSILPMEPYKTQYKKLIFVYNFIPRNFQMVIDISLFIKKASECFNNCLFIIARYDQKLDNIQNILFCDRDFKYFPTRNCSNLLFIAKITNECDIIISQINGASWIWLNNNLKTANKHIFLFDDCNDDNKKESLEIDFFSKGYSKTYIPKLNAWYSAATQVTMNIVNYLHYDIDSAIDMLNTAIDK